MAQSGKLFLFPVPIAEGKLCGVLPSLNAELLAGLTLFFVEKTRTARRFIRILCPEKDIAPIRFIEIGKRCDPSEIESGLKAVAQGASAGILSEAGCPGVADPGAEVVRKAHRLGIEVIPLIGPSSLLLALMASGQNGQQFAFKGYLPRRDDELRSELKRLGERIARTGEAQLFIETPYRTQKLFETILTHCAKAFLLTVASNITGEGGFVHSYSIEDWRKHRATLPEVPTVFILGK